MTDHKQVDAAPLSPLKRAFLALEEAEARIAGMTAAAREPIAIIGLGCRAPGGGRDAESFWRILRDKVDAIGPVPADRWDMDALYDSDPETPGRIATKWGGFLGAVDTFDAGFFGISPREAAGMDPQQRLLLEVAWEALENAALAPDRLESTATGVYVGVCASDYANMMLKSGDTGLLDAHFTSGIAHSIVSGRLSYLLGLQGPSLSIDTACSSSLVALHLAVQALRAGDCRMALAGGVNLILSPDLYIALSHSRMLAPDGRCKTFAAAADGFARGEGCGILVLKRLSDARADGDRVLAVVRGTAVNQDGPSSGLTAPNGPAQEAVIRDALQRAGISPTEVGYIEAHGTGTELGDPLEVQALGNVFGPGRDKANPLVIGSVKTNIGHLEGAAGVMGVIKLVLALQHREIPAHLHFDRPSPHIPWDDLPIEVPIAARPWREINGRRIGGVSSFGFSGTNAHAIVEGAGEEIAETRQTSRPYLLPLSARTATARAAVAAEMSRALSGRAESDLGDICDTAASGRAHHAHRATIVARTLAEARAGLDALANGTDAPHVRTAVAPRDPPRIAFLFTGQGAQYAGMARGLYGASETFRAALDRCSAGLSPHMRRPLLDVLFDADATALDATEFTQPALFAVEYGLAEMLRQAGIVPSIVAGHSVGEYVAATIAGVMDLEAALRLIARRGALMQSLPAGGGMVAVLADRARVNRHLSRYAGKVSIAAMNGPAQTVLSGDLGMLEDISQGLAADGIKTQRLAVSHGFHSPLVEPILGAFERELADIRLSPPRLKLVSNLTGQLASPQEITKPAYWRRHLREAVDFLGCLETIAASTPDLIVEIGPNSALLSFAATTLGEAAPPLLPTLRKGRDDWEEMQRCLSSLYLAGCKIDWRGLRGSAGRRVVDLPSYPFERQRHWFSARTMRGAPASAADAHPILGTRIRSASRIAMYHAHVSADAPSFVRHHEVGGQVILPATGYLDALLVAAEAQLGTGMIALENVVIGEAMLLPADNEARLVETLCTPAGAGTVQLSIASMPADASTAAAWSEHVTASARTREARPDGRVQLADISRACPNGIDVADLYDRLRRRGIAFGQDFRVVRTLLRGEREALGEIVLDPRLAGDRRGWRFHPVLLDGCLQVMAAILAGGETEDLYLPVGIRQFSVDATPPERCFSHVRILGDIGATAEADVSVVDETGRRIATIAGITLQKVGRDALDRQEMRQIDDCLYEIDWVPAPHAERSAHAEIAPEALARSAADVLPRLTDEAQIPVYDRFLAGLEGLCVSYILDAMAQLGWAPAVGDTVIASDLARRLSVQPRHERLFARLLQILGEALFLNRAGEGWSVRRPLEVADVEIAHARLAASCPTGADAELELTRRVASKLAPALRGDVDPMHLLFPGGSLETPERIYRESPTARVFNGMMAEVVAAAARARSEGRLLRILEIGGGTGGSTAHILPRLQDGSFEYVFTDVGPAFVAKARERFASRTGMRFATFDLERDGAEQGFDGQAFDIVIAANVIHATSDLRRTLARVHGLLAQGGLLVMLEVTAPQRWFDLTVGFTEGWWAFTDLDLRQDYATLPRPKWETLLAQCGFDAVRTLPSRSGLAGCLGLQSLFLARAAGSSAAVQRLLVVATPGGDARRVADAIAQRCGDCVVCDPSGVTLALANSAHRPFAAAIYCDALDIGSGALAPDVLMRAQEAGAIGASSLAKSLVSLSSAPRLVLVTRGAQCVAGADEALASAQAPMWGLARALAVEHPELRTTIVDLDSSASPERGGTMIVDEITAADAEFQLAYRDGARLAPRLRHLRRGPPIAADATPWRLAPARAGSFDELQRTPLALGAPGPGEVEIAVEASGLNFKDVLNALGMYPGDPGPLGGECAGVVVRVGAGVTHVRPGQAVIAVAGGSLASHVHARSELVQPRPAGISAEEGAGFPIAYMTAEFCLGHLAGLKAGERVLIHAAAGGVGLAAVRLAQRAGAHVFATAGAEWKRQLLRDMGIVHVLDSRSPDFAAEILQATSGHGVDVVLNSLSGPMIDASFSAIARGGRFIEIGKRGIKTPAEVAAMGRDLNYHVVDWGETSAREPQLIGGMMARLVADLASGALGSLPRHAFAVEDAGRAFALMSKAGHFGKIVLKHKPASPALARRDGTYLITGGTAGLGLEVARWLVNAGAGRIVLVSRRGDVPEAKNAIDEMKAAGATVVTAGLDVADAAGMRTLLQTLRSNGPPLRGVVHGAGILDDAALLQQDATRFSRVLEPKLAGGALLDSLTRADPLDWYVSFASIAGVLGSAGQVNHAAANAYLDLDAHRRRRLGLHALSIDWGAWGETGAAANAAAADRLRSQGIGRFTTRQGLAMFGRLLDADATQAVALAINWSTYVRQVRHGKAPAYLAALGGSARGATSPAVTQNVAAPAQDIVQDLQSAPAARRRALLTSFVSQAVSRTLGLGDAEGVDPAAPLGDLGLDSLLAVQLRNALSRALGAPLPATLLFDYPTIEALTAHLADDVLKLSGEPATGPEPAKPAPDSLIASIEEMSDEEVERMIASRSQKKA